LPVSAVDAINPAFQHAKQQLLQPFRFALWIRLAFVGFLAGEAGSGGGCNFNGNIPSSNHPRGSQQFMDSPWIPQFIQHPEHYVGLIILLVVVAIGLFVLFTYISSVMRFILFDGIITRECRIRAGWVRNRDRGFRLFVWQILWTLAFPAALAVLAGSSALLVWRMRWFDHPSDHLLPLIFGGIAAFLVLLLLVLVFSVVYVMTKDFVVPQMALEDTTAIEGWRRLWSSLSAEKGGYAGYIGMKIVMAIGAGIVLGIATAIVAFAILIPIAGAGVAAVLAGKAAGLTWTFYTIAAAVIVGCVALAFLFFVGSLISVPAIVFFPAYSIYFFAPRYPALAKLLWPQPPPSQSPGWPTPPLPLVPALLIF